jgi:hypothetical protein
VSSGRRITIALVGLVLLVVIGWLVKDLTHHSAAGSPGRSPITISAAGSIRHDPRLSFSE